MTHSLPPIDSLWDYGDPKATETRFRELWPQAKTLSDRKYEAELLTQIARTLGLQQRFSEAHETLDQAERFLPDAGARVRVRCLLERGRVWNSSGDKVRAVPGFVAAWDLAMEHGLSGLAVDAAHMVAIAKPDQALEWNLRALELAENASDPDARRWRGSLYNNLGWTYFERAQYDQALAYFKEALTCRMEQGKPDDIKVARWCVAKCRRFLHQTEEALSEQQRLEIEAREQGLPDGFIFEEIAECLSALGRTTEARPYFARAWEVLRTDPWLSRDEPARLARLLELSR